MIFLITFREISKEIGIIAYLWKCANNHEKGMKITISKNHCTMNALNFECRLKCFKSHNFSEAFKSPGSRKRCIFYTFSHIMNLFVPFKKS